uniref:Candidate secreted effector n=1 Tax=Meloidogyne incognita TaxID=6306 RepID=A0A914MFE4_MELIC
MRDNVCNIFSNCQTTRTSSRRRICSNTFSSCHSFRTSSSCRILCKTKQIK